MFVLEILLILSLFLIFYNYAGYALLVYVFNKIRSRQKVTPASGQWPSVSFIVAAYNEEEWIDKKVRNSLEQSYQGSIEFIFITDGSTDGTNDLIQSYPRIRLLYQPERRGKSAALNRAVAAAQNDILIFSDANTTLNVNAIHNIARHYVDSKVGGVAGEKKVMALDTQTDQVGASEGLYWKYESILKKLDSDFHSVVGAAGELFSLRRSLFEPVDASVILDDFIISMKVAAKGYKVVYEPDAYAMELPSFSIKDEQKRKVRIAAGGFQAMGLLRQYLSPFRQPRLYFLYFSHRVMRWTTSPVALITAFLCSILLYVRFPTTTYAVLFWAQFGLYLMAFLAAVLPQKFKHFKLLKLAYYFVFMNFSVIQGFIRSIKGSQSAVWEKARRSADIRPENSTNAL
jgi:cellulose synthase/poly-beta-1,6-N-acetylglucosamine synthase-like glycosyltransferase